MTSGKQATVLISEPSTTDVGAPFLPYLWGILKSFAEEHHTDVASEYQWLDPIWETTDATTALRPYDGSNIDVLGLSCYTWNWDLQVQIAQQVKAQSPSCFVVAGGPHPDYKDPQFFTRYPFIDAVVVKDGEITFTNILRARLEGKKDYATVKGLYLPSECESGHSFTGPAEVPLKFEHSPYLEQESYYLQLMNTAGTPFNATWETNRGCPYSCSYCDWGSNTMSKVRSFDIDRVRAEIEWFGRNHVKTVILADANFGIFKRDLEIADLVGEIRGKYGFPTYLGYCNAKNNPERTVEISRKFYATGVMSRYELSVQHTRPEVLEATSRANISADKQMQVVTELMEDGVPIEVQLITGIPGDTYDLWKSSFGDLMERGIHSTYQVFKYQLLPNAPASDPTFLAKWRPQTIERYSMTSNHQARKDFDLSKSSKGRFVVESSSYSREDWVKMNVYTAFIKSLHSSGLTPLVSQYMRFTHDVTYREFYEDVIENFCAKNDAVRPTYDRLVAHYQNFLTDDEAIDFIEVPDVPALKWRLTPHQWLLGEFSRRASSFYDALADYMQSRYPDVPNLVSVVEYQRNMLILPSYDRRHGKVFSTDLDWVAYFKAAAALRGGDPAPEPTSGEFEVSVSDQTCSDSVRTYELDWGALAGEERWLKWVERVALDHNSPQRNNHQALEVGPRSQLLRTSPLAVAAVRSAVSWLVRR